MRINPSLITFCICVLTPLSVLAAPADSVYLNGSIYTSSAAQAWAEAVAIRDGKFAFVGDSTEAEKYIGPSTLVHDLEGRMAMPESTTRTPTCYGQG